VALRVRKSVVVDALERRATGYEMNISLARAEILRNTLLLPFFDDLLKEKLGHLVILFISFLYLLRACASLVSKTAINSRIGA